MLPDATFICKASFVITLLFVHWYFITLNKTPKKKDLRQEICFVQAPSKLNRNPIWVTLGTEMREEQQQEPEETFSTHTYIPYPGEKALINPLIKLKLFALNYHTHFSFSVLPIGGSSQCIVLQLIFP